MKFYDVNEKGECIQRLTLPESVAFEKRYIQIN